MKRHFHLLLIDPQNDFIDLPQDWLPPDTAKGSTKLAPALPVNGAHMDMLRVAGAVGTGIDGIAEITVTLDSHHFVGIERPTFWVKGDGGDVAPFTQITLAQVEAGEFLPRDTKVLQRVCRYLRELESRGRYKLMVWPVHCEMGTWGHAVHDEIRRACNEWEQSRQTYVNFVAKGTNPWTEHYSPFQAEVPDVSSPETLLNRALIRSLGRSDRIYVAGQASSHCVKAGVEDLAEHLGGDLSRIVLVRDGMSAVSGFESVQTGFFADMQLRGLRLCTAAEMAEELQANA